MSISGGISNSVDNALQEECTAFQIFSRNPRGWAAKPLDSKDVALFKNKLAGRTDDNESTKTAPHTTDKTKKIGKNKKEIDKSAIFVHMPYLPNLSSPNKIIYDQSVGVLIDELNRCNTLEIPFFVVHL